MRRASGPWTPAVHALLQHLAAVGFTQAPQVLGTDKQGREILSFLPGETIPASLAGYGADETLSEAADLLRRYHEATTTFVPPADAAWRFGRFTPGPAEVVCHNDFAPYNTIVRDGHVAGLIDWDFVTPGPRIWDLAYALWRFVPLYSDESFGPPAERARRIQLFCGAYGLPHSPNLLAAIRARQLASYEALRAWAAEGQPAFAKMWREGHALGVLDDVAYLDSHYRELAAHLSL